MNLDSGWLAAEFTAEGVFSEFSIRDIVISYFYKSTTVGGDMSSP